jgi:hypothetical protein
MVLLIRGTGVDKMGSGPEAHQIIELGGGECCIDTESFPSRFEATGTRGDFRMRFGRAFRPEMRSNPAAAHPFRPCQNWAFLVSAKY